MKGVYYSQSVCIINAASQPQGHFLFFKCPNSTQISVSVLDSRAAEETTEFQTSSLMQIIFIDFVQLTLQHWP